MNRAGDAMAEGRNHQTIGWKRRSATVCGWISPVLALATWSFAMPKLGGVTIADVLRQSCVAALAVGMGLSAVRYANGVPRRWGAMTLVATVPLVVLLIVVGLWDGRWYRIYKWWTSWRRLYQWPPGWEFLGY